MSHVNPRTLSAGDRVFWIRKRNGFETQVHEAEVYYVATPKRVCVKLPAPTGSSVVIKYVPIEDLVLNLEGMGVA